jgi:DNA-binding NtrC family response regulator
MRHASARLLVADDARDILDALELLFRSEGYEVSTAASPAAVLAAVEERDYDALLMDMNYMRDTTGGTEGLDLLSRLQQLDATLPVVVMTSRNPSTTSVSSRCCARRWNSAARSAAASASRARTSRCAPSARRSSSPNPPRCSPCCG